MNLRTALRIFGFESAQDISPESLKQTYKVLAKTLHPDKGGDSKAFVEMNKSYEFLKIYLDEKSKMGASDEDFTIPAQHTAKPKDYSKVAKDVRKIAEVADEDRELFASQKVVISHQRKLINKTQDVAVDITKDYKKRKIELETEFDGLLKKIKKQHSGNIFMKMFGYKTKEYEEHYREALEKYEIIKSDLETDYNAQLVYLYGEALNAISDSVEKALME